MIITDVFIKRPVLSIVVSLLILILGLKALSQLPIREFPYTENAVVTVSTSYFGADAALIAGFITRPLENSIAQSDGIDYMTSTSHQGSSIIQANLRLNYDSNRAASEINTRVNAVLNQLPKDAEPPTITVDIGQTIDSMYIGFYSDTLPSNKITDYIIRLVQPKLQAVPGVQQAELIGQRTFALRAWLNPDKLAAYNMTATDVYNALSTNDVISAVGRIDGQMITVNLTANTGLESVDEFKQLVLKTSNGVMIRLEDVANIMLGSNNYDTAVGFDGKSAIYIGIKAVPSANILTVIDGVKAILPDIQAQFPQGLSGKIVYDATKYIKSSIKEVEKSFIEALLIVTVVIFLFLGSVRSVMIPVIAMPLSIVGTFFIMLLCGYSVNLLTLLALVLAIGLVVDDAIIVVENIHRHIENGMQPLKAAFVGARELASPIIAISVVLIAVYVPIGFMGGLTGALFSEFAFSLAGAVGVSAIIALTLSPMMCSKLLLEHNKNGNKLVQIVDNAFDKLRNKYKDKLHNSLDYLPVTIVFAVIVFISIYFLYVGSKSELAPQEDKGIIIAVHSGAPNDSLRQTSITSHEIYKDFVKYPETDHVFQLDGVNGLNSGVVGMVLKPWDQRRRTTNQLQPLVQSDLDKIAASKIAVFQPAPLPGSKGLPLQIVILTTDSYEKLDEIADSFIHELEQTKMFMYLDKDLKIDKQQVEIKIDRDKAAQLGLSMKDVGNQLASSLSGGYINYFNYNDRAYQVIAQVEGRERINYEQVLNYYIKTPSGTAVPMSTIATLHPTVVPESVVHFQQLNSVTISGIQYPGIAIGDVLKIVTGLANKMLPQGYSLDYAGPSRQYVQESSSIMGTFFFAIIIIFLSLAALFESFRDPLIVLISVPMSICGALMFISLGIGGASLNIYTEVGLVTLIGLISKHGILIVQFANDLQKEGKTKREAIELATSIRLRPILMTTAAMVLGVVPLLTASGAGAVSRFNIGLVIASGISIGTLFTLFVVPAMYMLLARVPKQEVTE
jgi:multidrug efflux pump